MVNPSYLMALDAYYTLDIRQFRPLDVAGEGEPRVRCDTCELARSRSSAP
jgi:hypothetical protein